MYLVKNAEVHVGNGTVYKNCDVLIENDKIKEVGQGLCSEEKTEIIDASGCVVLPGFIDTMNSWGAKGPSWEDDDMSEITDPVNPHLNSVYAFDHDAMNFQEVYQYGVTAFGLAPSVNTVVGGRISVFKTYGDGPYEMLVKEDVGVIASVSSAVKETFRRENRAPSTKMGIFALLRQELTKALNYRAQDGYSAKYEVLKQVLTGQMPFFVNCTKKMDIDSVLRLNREFNLDVILTGAYSLSTSPSHSFSKIVLGNLTGGMLPETYEVGAEAVQRSMSEGSVIAISSCGDHDAGGKESLLWNAILYYQRGLDAEDVLKMITWNPARILGVEDRIGSIEKGKDADIVVWSHNPILTFKARPLHCFVSGRALSTVKRRTSCW